MMEIPLNSFGAIKLARAYDTEAKVTKSGLWYCTKTQRFVVWHVKATPIGGKEYDYSRTVVTSITEKFIAQNVDDQLSLWDGAHDQLDSFEKRLRKH